MYQCRVCNEIISSPADYYDEYDKEIYKKCPYCGGRVYEPDAFCALCGNVLLSGEKAIEIGSTLYCTSCASSVIV